MACISGPPWMPGKMAEFTFLAIASSLVRIMPPRGPRKVLCVVVVATSAKPSGLGCNPAATSPAKWAMSTKRYAPTSSATERGSGQSRSGADRRNRPHDNFRSAFARQRGHCVIVDAVIRAQPIGHGIEPFARLVGPRPVGQVPASIKRQAKDGVAGQFGQCHEHGLMA